MVTAMFTKILAHAALLTAINSGWMLFQKTRQARNDHSVRNEITPVYLRLESAYIQGLLSISDHSYWRKKLQDAEKECDCESRTRSPVTFS